MKKITFIFALLIILPLSAQEGFPLNSMLSLYGKQNAGSILESQFGRNAISIDDDNISIKNYKGSLLLLNTWSQGVIKFTDGREVRIPYMNYDALNDNFIVYFKNLKEPIDGVATPDLPLAGIKTESVVSIVLQNEMDGTKKFIKASPNRFAEKPKTRYFEFFSDQAKDASVLKSTYKKIKTNHLKGMPYSDSNEDYEFKTYHQYYIKNKNKIFVPVRLNKKGVLKALHDQQNNKVLKKYIKKQHLKMGNPVDVQKFLDYYFQNFQQ